MTDQRKFTFEANLFKWRAVAALVADNLAPLAPNLVQKSVGFIATQGFEAFSVTLGAVLCDFVPVYIEFTNCDGFVAMDDKKVDFLSEALGNSIEILVTFTSFAFPAELLLSLKKKGISVVQIDPFQVLVNDVYEKKWLQRAVNKKGIGRQ